MEQSVRNIVVALAIALAAAAAAYLAGLVATQVALVGIVALLVALWTNEGLSMAVVSLLPIVLFPAFGVLEAKPTAHNYAHPIIFLFLGGFLIAIAVEKSGLHTWIAAKMLGIFPNTARGVIFALTLTAGTLSALLSNTTTTLLLLAIALYLSDDPKLKMRFALAIAYGATIGGIMTPIGTPPNLILFGIMQEKGMAMIAFTHWMGMVLPLALFMFAFVSYVLGLGVQAVRMTPPQHVKRLSHDQRKVIYLIGALIVLLLINAPIRPWWDGLGMSESVLLLAAGLLLFAPPFGLLRWETDQAKVPFRIMFLFGAGFAIAGAFSKTGLADEVAGYLLHFSDLTPLLLLLLLAVVITFTTEITSNTALISIMLPVIYSVSIQAELDATLFMMVATICSSYAFMLPIATPPNAIAMASGAVPVRMMALYGVVFNVVGIAFVIFLARFFWSEALH